MYEARWGWLAGNAGWLLAAVLVAGVIWLVAFSDGAHAREGIVKPVPRPVGLVRARVECPERASIVECRAALRRALAANAWQRRETAKARLHARIAPVTRLTPLEVGAALTRRRGWGSAEFDCLARLWSRESGWRPSAVNRSSGAAGIPQALPGRKMASAGPDWRTNPATQITWGLRYIAARYGTPCAALGHSNTNGWY